MLLHKLYITLSKKKTVYQIIEVLLVKKKKTIEVFVYLFIETLPKILFIVQHSSHRK